MHAEAESVARAHTPNPNPNSPITFRLSENELAELKARAASEGKSISAYVRETLALRENQDQIDGLNARVEVLWRKVAHLEEIAGI